MEGFHESSELYNDENASHGISDGVTDGGVDIVENISLQETTARIEEWQEQVSENEVREWQRSANVELAERSYDSRQVPNEDWQGHTANGTSLVVQTEVVAEHNPLRELGEVSHEQSQQNSEGTVDIIENSEVNSVPPESGQESPDHIETWQGVMENEEHDWQGASLESNEWRNGAGEEMDENRQELAANEWSEVGEHSHLQDGFQEAMQNWLAGPSEQVVFPVERVDSFYLPDDDNVYNMELRELLSR